MIDGFSGSRPGRIREREISRPENMIGTDVIGKRRDLIVPSVEETLALEHLERREIVSLTCQTVMFELVIGPFEIEHAPTKRALSQYQAQLRVA